MHEKLKYSKILVTDGTQTGVNIAYTESFFGVKNPALKFSTFLSIRILTLFSTLFTREPQSDTLYRDPLRLVWTCLQELQQTSLYNEANVLKTMDRLIRDLLLK